jgi:hypothetical protein
MTASGLADVLVGDTDPGVLVRLGDDPLEQLPLALLDVRPIREPPADVLDPPRERVPDPLELGDLQHAGAAGGRDRELDASSRERGREQLRELALERRDLAPQVPADASLLVLAYPAGGQRRPSPE